MTLKISVIYGSVREGRQGIKAAKFMVNSLKEKGHHVNFIDPLEYKFPLLQKRLKEYPEGTAPELIEKVGKIFEDSDAFVIVTAEYNHGVPPALKNIIDHYGKEYAHKPSAIVCYSGGPFGGVRAAMQWRAILAECGMPSIPKVFPIPAVQDAFDNQGVPNDPAYKTRADAFISELEWYAQALKAHREKSH